MISLFVEDTKREMIKEYFSKSDFSPMNIEVIDTGLDTMTGGRLKRIQNKIDDTFCLTYWRWS